MRPAGRSSPLRLTPLKIDDAEERIDGVGLLARGPVALVVLLVLDDVRLRVEAVLHLGQQPRAWICRLTMPSYVLKRRLCSSSCGPSSLAKKARTRPCLHALSPPGIGGILMVTSVLYVICAVAV